MKDQPSADVYQDMCLLLWQEIEEMIGQLRQFQQQITIISRLAAEEKQGLSAKR